MAILKKRKKDIYGFIFYAYLQSTFNDIYISWYLHSFT